MKKFLLRFKNGFCYSIVILTVLQLIINVATGAECMLPEYMARFDNVLVAYGVQQMLIATISGIASGGTVILEWKRPGLVIQSLIYLALMLAIWIPVGCFLWGFHKYVTSMISVVLSIIVTYGINWVVQYKVCRRDVDEINRRLLQKQENVKEA